MWALILAQACLQLYKIPIYQYPNWYRLRNWQILSSSIGGKTILTRELFVLSINYYGKHWSTL